MSARIPLVLVAALVVAAFAAAHAERPTASPARAGAVPDPDRAPTATLDVCKTFIDGEPECDYQHIQAAVNAAPNGALIQIWPGLYNEEPSRAAPTNSPGPDGHFSYAQQLAEPNGQNLIAILGKTNITLRGMGNDPHDVVIDVAFTKHVGIRGDRADGIVIQNLAVYHAFDHGVYVLDLDGFWIEGVYSAWSYEYDFLMFATDHGVLRDCVAVGAGDAGIYPGGTPDTPGRHSVEVANCESRHNVLGYSGTQGNYVWVHDNLFEDNGVGIVSDSETDHPNYPQKGSVFERNVIRNNNLNIYDSSCTVDCVRPTVFVGSILLPVGTGLFLASNNDNVVRDNVVYGNDRVGVWLASGQAIVIGPTSDPPAPPFLSSGNRFEGNAFHATGGNANGVDVGWDGLGIGNCWQDNVRAGGAPPTTDGAILPPCSVAGEPLPATASAPNPSNLVGQVGLVYVEGPEGNRPLCHYAGLEPCIGGDVDPQTGLVVGRNTAAGYVPPPTPPTCGPSSSAACWE